MTAILADTGLTVRYLNSVEELGSIYLELDQRWGRMDLTAFFRGTLVPWLSQIHEDYFNQQAGPEGPWEKLAPATVKAKGFDTILIEMNNMRSSLLFPTGDHIEDIEPLFITWGTDDAKAAFHQFGTANVPARPFVGLTEQHVDTIVEQIADAVVARMMM